jgi:hypothetical protein
MNRVGATPFLQLIECLIARQPITGPATHHRILFGINFDRVVASYYF